MDDDETPSPNQEEVEKKNKIDSAAITEAKDKLIVNTATIQKL